MADEKPSADKASGPPEERWATARGGPGAGPEGSSSHPAVASLALTFGILSAFALIASAAASFTWTSQSDFLSGRLTDLDASTSPGDLLLARTVTDWARSPANPVFGPGTGG